MPKPPVSTASWIATFAWRRLARRVRALELPELTESAIVFSPHYDDECLGCGGTLLKRHRAGAATTLVFMTDGTGSHRGTIPADEISRIRHEEGNAAGQALGLSAKDVLHLDFPETQLARFRQPASERIGGLLRTLRPQAVFVPFRGEPHLWSDDHVATTESVFAALGRHDAPVKVYEYPVWYWFQWPWVHPSPRRRREARIILRNSAAMRRGAHRAGQLNACCGIADELPAKWAALNQHASQMTRLHRERPWPTLHDVGGGQFLACFFQPYEFFAASLHPAALPPPAPARGDAVPCLSASDDNPGTHIHHDTIA